MTEEPLKPLDQCLALLSVMQGDKWTNAHIDLYEVVLESIPDSIRLAVVKKAVATLEWRPAPAKLLSMAQEIAYRIPGPEDAWGMCPRSEEETVCWTSEMARAYSAARPFLFPEFGEPDVIAARMAFLEAYRREVAEFRLSGLLPCWEVSEGTITSPGGRWVYDKLIKDHIWQSESREEADGRFNAIRSQTGSAVQRVISRGYLKQDEAVRLGLMPAPQPELKQLDGRARDLIAGISERLAISGMDAA